MRILALVLFGFVGVLPAAVRVRRVVVESDSIAEAENLYRLLKDTLEMPVAWAASEEKGVFSAGIDLGNLELEFRSRPKDKTVGTRFQGIVLTRCNDESTAVVPLLNTANVAVHCKPESPVRTAPWTGGVLGVVKVKEIDVGVPERSALNEAFAKLRVSGGAAIRVVPYAQYRIRSLVLNVKSEKAAKSFLAAHGLTLNAFLGLDFKFVEALQPGVQH